MNYYDMPCLNPKTDKEKLEMTKMKMILEMGGQKIP